MVLFVASFIVLIDFYFWSKIVLIDKFSTGILMDLRHVHILATQTVVPENKSNYMELDRNSVLFSTFFSHLDN